MPNIVHIARRLAELSEKVLPPPAAARAIAAVETRWGEPEMRELPRLVPADRVAVDVGASGGVYTHVLSRLAREVHAFEPNPVSSAAIRRRVPKAVVYEFALSDRTGDAYLRVPVVGGVAYSGWGTCEASNRFSSLQVGEVQRLPVRTRTLDSFGLRNVGFMKIDVEGHELAVLRGAAETLRRERPTLLIEAEDKHRPRAVLELKDFLADLDYKLGESTGSGNNFFFIA
jgi:FkbM family methyltransferase